MIVEQALGRLPFFSQLSAAERQELARLGRTIIVPAGHVVCSEGESSDGLYVLLAGKVLVSRDDDSGHRVDLREYVDGDYFGEISLLDSKPRTATVACLTECRLFVLQQAEFRATLTAHPSIVFSVLAAVADRAREHSDERYRVELANLTLEAQAEIERHRTLAQMVAGVAHELNTPLGITNTAVDMLANRLDRPDVAALFGSSDQTRRLFDDLQEAATLARRNIARAHTLIQDFKKISVDQLVDDPRREDLAELVTSTVDLFRINARQAKLTIAVDDQLPATDRAWFGHPGHLTQVLLNLLSNVERYAYEPGIGGRVDIVLSASRTQPDPMFTITVRDYGYGIAAERLEDVFEPFSTTGRDRGGTGLGLSIVRNIVTAALNGEITVDSAPGHGATFHVTFPQEVTHVQHELAHSDRRRRA